MLSSSLRLSGLLLLLLGLLSVSGCDRGELSLDEVAGDQAAYRLHSSTVDSPDGPVLRVEVEPLAPYRVNLEFPWALMVPVKDMQLASGDASRLDEARAVFEFPAGTSTGLVEGNLRLSVCTDDICLTPRERIRWEVASGE
ncbi:MAG: hypothetical protein EA398_08430 [Deltaproteobacteria bacterium]|nr:MAG: hypothetical protein EA398_08430 [Deltaproteobacteria bacterium]